MNKNKNIEDAYILSPMQQGMLFHSLYDPKSAVYLEQFSYELEGELNLTAFENAWQQVVDRHPALRTAFVWENIDRPHQIVCQRVKLPWHYYDWRAQPSARQEEYLHDLLISDRTKGFQLTRAPLMRLSLVHLAEKSYQLIWSHHHLILDGWSVSLLLKEVMDFYQALCHSQELQLEKPQPYRNYIAWLQQQDKSEAEAFWRQKLTGFTTPTSLGVDSKPASQIAEILEQDEQQLYLSTATTEKLQSSLRKSQITLNTLIQGLWAIILGCYSQENNVVFGATSSGRPVTLSGADATIGLFINTLPVRVDLDPEADLVSWLKQLQSNQFEIRQYEYSSLSEIQQWSEIAKGTPLFESIVVFQNLPVDTAVQEWIDSLNIRNLQTFQQTNYPLTITAELDSSLAIKIAYERNRFPADAIARMLGHFQNLLEAVVANPISKLSELSLLTLAEKQQLLFDWNNTQVEYPTDKCIHQLFEEQVELTPDAIAVVWGDQQLTYRQLNNKANQLANYLRKKKQERSAQKERLIGICVNRSLEMIIGILGILKAGWAYVPIDPNYPRDRIAYILSDADISLLLTQEYLSKQLPSVEIVSLDTDWQIISTEGSSNLNSDVSPSNLAYCIYTSGSTGTPKGVLIQHDSLVNFVSSAVDKYKITEKDRVLQFASISFDAAVEEIYPCLICGGTLVLRSEEMLSYGQLFFQKCLELQITILDLPTAYWHQLMSDIEQTDLVLPESIRLVIIGGEQAIPKFVTTWQTRIGNTPTLINSYGPTEVTVVTTTFQVPSIATGRVAIGKPINNLQTYVLDKYLQPLPIGVKGELYIGGAGVARGYLNRPDLNAQRFIADPFSHQTGQKLYRTGDLVRYLADGNLEFIGRVDEQVKVRGFRVELGEVEASLNQHPSIDKSVVILYEDDSENKNLIAYITLFPELRVTTSQLRDFLQSKLPNYAIPKAFVILTEMPLTTSGKIDRQALPAPDLNQLLSAANFVAPNTLTEKILAQIWSQILGIEKVGINDNFFELGGDSIVSIQIVAKANRVGLQLEPRQLFQYQTIAELAQVARLSQAEPKTKSSPLTPSQHQFLSQNRGKSHLYNQLLSVEIDSAVKPRLLKAALEYLIRYHDVFNLSFVANESGWQQVYGSVNEHKALTQIDLSAFAESQREEAIASVITELQSQQNFSSTIPVKFILFDFGIKQNKILLITGNCLAVDFFSFKLVLEDLETAYLQLSQGKAIHLPANTISFQEWSQYLQEYAQSDEIRSEQDYWLEQIHQPFISLPVDYHAQETKKINTDVVSVFLSRQETQNLLANRVHDAYNTKIEDLLLTALVQTFIKWTKKPELWIDFINHNRPERFKNLNLSRTVGQFTSCYPIFFDLSEAINLKKTLMTVKENLRSVSHRISYNIFHYLDCQSEMKSRLQDLPQPEICFNYLDNWHQLDKNSTFKPVISDSYLLDLDVEQSYKHEIKAYILAGQFHCNWEYNQSIYQRKTIEAKANDLITTLKDLVIHCLSVEETRYTSSDFPQANLSQQKLDKFLAKINQASK